jgi:glycosyltransferase involved in cell wall biosynthesis
MDFSRDMAEVGRFGLAKALRLLRMIGRVLRVRFTTAARVLYYPPAGPHAVPVMRDIVFLLIARPFFARLVLDVHAAGVEEFETRMPRMLRWAFRRAYYDADLLIERYQSHPGGHPLRPRATRVVPYGVPDHRAQHPPHSASHPGLRVLYVGILSEGKGVWTLLEAMKLLRDRGVPFHAVLVGEGDGRRTLDSIEIFLQEQQLESHVHLAGRLTGESKWRQFADADVFCFPSHYENEALPLAIIEAMQFELPVVATRWRGIPTLVRHGMTGFLVPTRDPGAVADTLQTLAASDLLRRELGCNGRQAYLERFCNERYFEGMEEALLSVAPQERATAGGRADA